MHFKKIDNSNINDLPIEVITDSINRLQARIKEGEIKIIFNGKSIGTLNYLGLCGNQLESMLTYDINGYAGLLLQMPYSLKVIGVIKSTPRNKSFEITHLEAELENVGKTAAI